MLNNEYMRLEEEERLMTRCDSLAQLADNKAPLAVGGAKSSVRISVLGGISDAFARMPPGQQVN